VKHVQLRSQYEYSLKFTREDEYCLNLSRETTSKYNAEVDCHINPSLISTRIVKVIGLFSKTIGLSDRCQERKWKLLNLKCLEITYQ
jgi:hypothetical protein